jgi:hypothetical protein
MLRKVRDRLGYRGIQRYVSNHAEDGSDYCPWSSLHLRAKEPGECADDEMANDPLGL